MISNDLSEIKKTPRRNGPNSKGKLENNRSHLEVFEHSFHTLQGCTLMLFSNQEFNFNFDTVASLLTLLFAEGKIYRSALCA